MEKEHIEKIVRTDLPVGEPVTERKIQNVVNDLLETVDWSAGKDPEPKVEKSVDWSSGRD